MKIEEQIFINKFGQDLVTLPQVLSLFNQLGQDQKRKFLTDLSFYLLQLKANDEDIDEAIALGQLKPTYTPCVKIKKGIKGNTLQELVDLPTSESEKVAILFLALFKIAYQRLLSKEKDSPEKWWFQDLSDETFINRIISLSNLRLVIRKIFNSQGKETGAIITAFIPFPINLYEKNIVERHLQLYAFNNLYPNTGINLYHEIHDDSASLVVIKNINDLDYVESKISIY